MKKQKIMISAVLALVLAVNAAAAVTVKGSTTVLPFAQKAAEVYMNNNPGKDVTVAGGGSGVGIAALIDGTTDIATSSRIIKDSERAVFEGNLTVYEVAQDAVALIVNSSNKVNNLTQEQVKKIYSGQVKNWKEVGGGDVKIILITRETTSGTFEAFKTFTGLSRLKGSQAVSNAAVATAVAQAPGAVGYVGLDFTQRDGVKPLTLDGVMPSAESVTKRTYPYSRFLYMAAKANARQEVKDFVTFVQSDAGQKIAEGVGLVPMYHEQPKKAEPAYDAKTDK